MFQNIAIIGLGRMGRRYDALLGARWIVDPQPHPGRSQYHTVQEFLAAELTTDLVIIASPTPTHFRIARALLKAGHNLLVEKPLCTSAGEARILERLAAARGLILCQSTLERYNPVVQYLRALPRDSIRSIESFRFAPCPPGSCAAEGLLDLGIHDIDLSFHLFSAAIPWQVHAGYGEPRREIVVNLKGGDSLVFDLLGRRWRSGAGWHEVTATSNPILELVGALYTRRTAMNERWSAEIALLEQREPPGRIAPGAGRGGSIELAGQGAAPAGSAP